MQRLKMGIFIALISLGIAAPVASQAQWVEGDTTYVHGSESVTENGTGHHTIGVHSTYGGVTVYADPPSGGSSDVEVTLGYTWHWTGSTDTIPDLSVVPSGDLAGTCPWPLPGAYLFSHVETFGLMETRDSTMKPGPYGDPVNGIRWPFKAGGSSTISVTAQAHAIATLPGGPFSSGANADAVVYWMQ